MAERDIVIHLFWSGTIRDQNIDDHHRIKKLEANTTYKEVA